MSRFIKFDHHKFDLGVGKFGQEYVEIRNRLSYFERQRLISTMLDVDIASSGGYNMKADPGKYNPAILETYLVNWQMYDDEGQLVPFSREAIARLDEETCKLIIEHIDQAEKDFEESKKVIAIEIESGQR